MNHNEISKLTDMGFSEEQAVKALDITNNDVELAIAYLFEDPIEVNDPNDDQRKSQYESTIEILNPLEIPDLSSYDKVGLDEQNHFEHRDLPAFGSEGNYQQDVADEDEDDDETSVYSMSNRLLRGDSEPPTVLPSENGRYENYLIPALQILSQVDKFVLMWVPNAKFDFGNDKTWYNPNYITEVNVPDTIELSKVSSYKFVVELERLLGYLHGLSSRSFISSKRLLLNIPHAGGVIHSRAEEFEDLFDKLYATLNKSHEAIFGSEKRITNLFNSVVQSVQDEVKNSMTVLTIDHEARTRTIYESLNAMFWTDEDTLGDINFVEIAPILTIPLFGDSGYGVGPGPFTLHEYFYPQIYSSKYSNLVVDMNKKRRDIVSQRNEISKEMMALNSFEGKRVPGFLQASISFLKGKDSSAEEDLLGLQEQLLQEKSDLSEKLGRLNEQYLKLDITQYENILDMISSQQDQPEPYLLIGVILSDTEYFYKDKSRSTQDEDWIHFNAILSKNNEINDYLLETMAFEGVQQSVYDFSRDASKSMILIYASSEIFNENIDIVVPEELQKFFDDDNKILALLLSQSERSNDDSKEELIDNSDQHSNNSSKRPPNSSELPEESALLIDL
ncbi:uncharacterized protein PRCAT00000941001 [Priceomyces carsonii]|uniref:uncharacterized protein n=1 Tax=Priceomyces carsonii TaxID=28549 RepID=UPI002EDB354D|nr:unnamed protein product [Priceomyces carsonii]